MQHYNIKLINKLTDFRAYCNEFFEAERHELEEFFKQDALMEKQYWEDKGVFQ
jgi:hypothetical protein